MKKKSKKIILLTLVVSVLLIPNLRVYSSIGSYSEKSMAIGGNKLSGQSNLGNNQVVGWQAAAVAICAAYFAGWVVGTIAHHAVDNFLVVSDPELNKMATRKYNSMVYPKSWTL